jgi:hypothetical protein
VSLFGHGTKKQKEQLDMSDDDMRRFNLPSGVTKATHAERLVWVKGVFNNEVGGEYAGATLNGMIKKELNFFVVGKGQTEEENFWVALCYIKYRSPGKRYSDAMAIVNKYPDRADLVAKAMLWAVPT